MRPIRSVSVLMPTWQGMEFLERVMTALSGQVLDIPWDFRAIDSRSTDGTWEFLGEWAERLPVPLERERIHQVEFDHGDTRNLLAARSRGDLLVFLTQDAIPVGTDWLAKLVKNFEDERVGAAYCRNLPRPDADLLTKVFSEQDPGYTAGRRETRLPDASIYAAMDAHERRVLFNFNDVASAIRRELWERHPFPRTNFGEDVLMARALLEAGFTVVYDDEAVVEHSHDYDADECFSRGKIDGAFNAEWLDRICVGSRSDALVLTGRQLERDRVALESAGLSAADVERELKRVRAQREATFLGLWEGGRTAPRQPTTTMRDETTLSVLYVVHGFPPDTWAGTEIYTYNLAKEMARRGHRVTVLARVPADDRDLPDFHVEDSEFQGLRVLRMTHRLEHASLRESYCQPKAEAAFNTILAREAPDLVHFQHLIHTSAGLVHVAKRAGMATVITCHDYWSICARVQLIRPDGEICPENMGSGCYLCVKERGLGLIPRMKRLDRAAGPLVGALAKGLRKGVELTGTSAGRWEGFDDMLDRQGYVVGAYAAADLRISPSRFLRQKLVDTAGFDPRRFLFSDNGMRTDHVHALQKEPDPEGRVRFGFVGSLVWYKGGETLIRAMRELAGEKVVLNVYGGFDPSSDPHHAELERLAEGAPVVFKGRFDNARLSEVYAEIDVLVVPSIWYENSPITIHEAYLTETPVLASDLGGMAEFVKDGVDGLLFEVGNPVDLAAKMLRFAHEPGLAADLSKDFMPIKTIEQNGEETEFRYRALCCIDRTSKPPGPRRFCDYTGIHALERYGPVEPQGADLLLMRPGGSAAEYDLRGAGGGSRRIEVGVLALGAEADVEMGGRVLVDGVEVGQLELFRPSGEDVLHRYVIRTQVAGDALRLRIETALSDGGPEAYLRIQHVHVDEVQA
jgi:glycosyltransferase involved in cell wall biosynthesis